MAIQYFFVAIIVITVVIWQYTAYRANGKRIERIKHLFPETNNCIVVKANDTTTIYCEGATGEFKETLDDINSYLTKNKNKTFDYHILKEIVNRNSQSLEDEVDTMISTPLYLGLIATILGIAFGVILFAWKDLANLLAGVNMNAEGIRILLTDVGIAMAASLCGVFFTKQSTSLFNDARTIMVKNKNRFLTWIQTDLMSKISDDITGAIIKMTQDLNEFNSLFAQNTKEFKETLSTINDNYAGQVKLLEAIDKIKINKIAKANIEVYDRLQGCTEEIEKLSAILAESESYITKVKELNEKIGPIEERTRLFENLGEYFKNEVEYVKDRQGMMRQLMSSIDSVLQDALSNMGDSLKASLQNLTQVFQSQNQSVVQLIEEQQTTLAESLRRQQKAVNEKIGQFDNPFDGLKETFAEGLTSIKGAFTEQNVTIKEMLSKQNSAFEDALKAQQEMVLQKLQSVPDWLQALTEIAKSIDKINKNIEKIGNRVPSKVGTLISHSQVGDDNDGQPKNKGIMAKMKAYFVPVCAIGSFFVLLALLFLQILAL